MRTSRLRGSLLLVCILGASTAWGQETRRAAVEELRAARAASVAPYKQGRLERTLFYIEQNRILERLTREDGLYLQIGSIQRGGGFAFGAGYRTPFAGDHLEFNADAAVTLKGYRVAGADISAPRLFSERLALMARGQYRYFPQEDYFGLGPQSEKEARSTFLLEERELAGIAQVRVTPWLTWSTKVAHLDPRIADGTDKLHPPIGELFSDVTAPGLVQQPTFLETGTLLELDTRDQRGNPRSGTYVSLLGARFGDLDDLGYDFARLGAEVQHYVPIFDKKRVIAVRAAFNRYEPQGGSTVPFYYILPLGGTDSIRGFTDFRFRDLNSVLFNAEYRWEAFSGLDMALFYDVGSVARRWNDLGSDGWKRSWGIGLRFNTYRSIFMRTELAFGSGEGSRFYVAFGGPLRLQRYLR
jgi:hypothetical protein